MAYPNPSASAPQVPLKKGMAIASLVLGVLGLPTAGILLLGALIGLILGIVALVKANRQPQVFGGKGLAIAGIVTNVIAVVIMPVILGILAAIAIPSLLRARVSANEASAIGDVRTVISAQMAYQSVNGNLYDTPACLGDPAHCIPNYSGPTFLSGTTASLANQRGYAPTFYPGPVPEALPQGASPSSVSSFAYVVVPVTPGQTGVRSFCGDSTGRVCYTESRVTPSVTNGQCDDSCVTLR